MARTVRPIHEEVFSSVFRRIVYRLIFSDYRQCNDPYRTYPPQAIYDLGQKYRMLFPALYPWFLFYSKNVAQGFKLSDLRDMPIEMAPRAVHKRRLHRPRS